MKLIDKVKVAMVGAVPMLGAASAAMAEFTVTPPTLDVAQLGTYVTAILTGLAAIWLARKFIKITNRS